MEEVRRYGAAAAAALYGMLELAPARRHHQAAPSSIANAVGRGFASAVSAGI